MMRETLETFIETLETFMSNNGFLLLFPILAGLIVYVLLPPNYRSRLISSDKLTLKLAKIEDDAVAAELKKLLLSQTKAGRPITHADFRDLHQLADDKIANRRTADRQQAVLLKAD